MRDRNILKILVMSVTLSFDSQLVTMTTHSEPYCYLQFFSLKFNNVTSKEA